MNRVLTGIGIWSASGVYGLVAILFMAWLLFPADFLRQWIPEYIKTQTSRLEITLGSLDLLLPASLHIKDLKASSAQQKQEFFSVTEFSVQPELLSLLKLEPKFLFSGNMHQGQLEGEIIRIRNSDAWQIKGTASDIETETISMVSEYLNRTIGGKVSVSYSGELPLGNPSMSKGEAELSLSAGTISLQQPLMGHQVIPFSRITCSLFWEGEKVMVEDGKVESELFTVMFNGNIEVGAPIGQSMVNITGRLLPTELFFEHVENKARLRAVLNQLDEEEFSFYVSGIAGEPGISFGEYSTLFDSLLIN